MEPIFLCKKCAWQGPESKLDFDEVETCFGNDQTEMCPKCGSVEVILLHSE